MLFDTNNELQAQQGEAYYNKLRKEKKLVEITEKRVMPTRTSQQNKTVHMWFGVFADFTGNPSREETKEQVIRAILGRKPMFNPYTGKEENGSKTDNYSQVVDSNLPKSFKLNIPLFKGFACEEIEVEIYADVDGRDVSLSLVSAGANETIEEYKNRVIDEQLDQIRAIAPNIAIIEV